MGGVDLNSEDFVSNDPLQLQQMIIFLEEEVDKYKSEVEKYQDSDHSSLIDLLERDNVQLMNDKNELSMELSALKKEFINNRQSEIEREDSALQHILDDYKTTIEKLENKLVNLIQEENKQVYYKIEQLERINQGNNQTKKVEERLVKELEEKNNMIEQLRQDLLDLKIKNKSLEKNELITSLNATAISTETLEQLDNQIKKVLTETLEYEKKLNDKLFVLNKFEQKIDQLTSEIIE